MPPRILFLVGDRREASVRFRVLQYVPHLERRGLETTIAETKGPLARRLLALRSAAQYEKVFVHRLLLSPVEAVLLRVSARGGYVYDFDDAIMYRDSTHPRQASWQRRRRLARMLRGARTVAAGNRYLAEWAARQHSRVEIVPTAVELDGFPPPSGHDEAAQESEVVGWIGTRSNLRYLETVLPAIRTLAGRRAACRLRVVCDLPLDAPHVPVENKRWSAAEEDADLRGFTVGIMPLADDLWTRGKCGLKILQYFAAARPVVCSPVGENRELVRDGENGYLASSESEWVGRLAELLGDPAKRARFGLAGRRWVEAHRSVTANLERFLCSFE